MRFEGWPLTVWLSLAVGVMSAAVLATLGSNEEGARSLIRATARSSLVFFLLAFTARPLRRVWRSPISGWLLRNRRHLGVSFFVSHLVHLAAILWLARIAPDFRADPVTVIGGGFGYLLAAAMTATSFDATATWLGRKRWKQLHTTGMFVLWAIFLFTFAGNIAVSTVYLLPTLALIAALGLRIAVRLQTRRRPAAA